MATSRELVRAAHARGLGNREIARELGLNHRSVADHLAELGLSTNNPRGLPPERIDDEHGRCPHCNRATRWEDFALVKSQEDGRRLTKCRDCRRRHQNDRLNGDIGLFLGDKVTRAKTRSKKLGVDFDLTKEWALASYDAQRGLCFYTDVELSARAGDGHSPQAVSFDRVDPQGGYLQTNVVLATNRANSIKQNVTLDELALWLPGWSERVMRWMEAAE